MKKQNLFLGFTVISLFLPISCSEGIRRSGIPAGAQNALDTSIEDIDAGRYEKLYNEAADEWRRNASLDESKATFQRLRDKLGTARRRDLQTAREEQTATAPIAGHSVADWRLDNLFTTAEGEIIAQHISYTNLIAELAPESVNEGYLKWLNTEVPATPAKLKKTTDSAD